jgi:hypothetical protein
MAWGTDQKLGSIFATILHVSERILGKWDRVAGVMSKPMCNEVIWDAEM